MLNADRNAVYCPCASSVWFTLSLASFSAKLGLSIGQRADMCIFDPAQHWKVDRHSLRSQGKNTPFLGIELAGKVHYTLVEGHVVFEGN